MKTVSYIIKWSRCDDSGTTCTIRGINQQGVFYGEWINWKTHDGGSIEGQLASHENIRLHDLLVNMQMSIQSESLQQDSGSPAPADTHNGLIGRGAYSAPSIMLRYRIGDESNRPAAAIFRQIVQLMDPILDQYLI